MHRIYQSKHPSEDLDALITMEQNRSNQTQERYQGPRDKRYRQDERYRHDERPRRDEQRTQFCERSRSREGDDRYPRSTGLGRYPPHFRYGSNLEPGRARSLSAPSNSQRSPPRNMRAAPPAPPQRRHPDVWGGGGCRKGVSGGYPDVGYMARRSTSLDWTSAGNWQPRAASLNPRQLTVELSKARALPELLSLQQRHGEHFNSLHVGAFWCKFKKLPRGNLGALDHLLASVCEQTFRMLPELDARNVTSVAHAFAKAGLVGTGPWQNVYIYIYIYI